MMRYLILIFFLSSIDLLSAQIEGISKIKMDSSMEYEGFEMLDSIIEGKRIVLTGENHSFYASNNVFKLKLILYLYDKGYRYFMLEFGQGIGYLANDYVTTGNKKSLKSLGSEENELLIELLLPLMKFNQGKNLEDQVKIVGVDFTRYPMYSLRALSNIIEQSNCEDELSIFYEDLNAVASFRQNANNIGFSIVDEDFDDFDFRSDFKSFENQLFSFSVKSLIQSFYEDTTSFKLALSNKYEDFKFLLDELNTTIKWYRGDRIKIQSHIERERHMEERVIGIFKQDTLAKVVGQFGRCHIRLNGFVEKCYAFEMNSIAERLNRIELLENKILILPIFYTNYKGEVISNKESSGVNQKGLINTNAMYLYRTSNNWFIFKYSRFLPEFALINSYSPQVNLRKIESEPNMIIISSKYRRSTGENHLSIFYQQQYISSNINNDFGIDIFPSVHQFYGLNYWGTNKLGWRTSIGGAFIIPRKKQIDNVDLRYTNWNLTIGTGYNWIYTSWFSFYSDVLMNVGSSKIKEDRGIAESEYTYDFEKKKVNYRNPYVTFIGASGIQFKFKCISVFGEVGYGYDVTNPKWRNKGPLQNSTGQKFGEYYFKIGLTYYTKNP